MKTYIGIDGGVTGAMAAVDLNDSWTFFPVSVIDCGKDRKLDVFKNLAFIDAAVELAGGPENVMVVYERAKKNKLFGSKGNFLNGQNEEFWRVNLTRSRLAFCAVDPNTWQHDLLVGTVIGDDTKAMAKVYLDQRYPIVRLEAQYNRARQEAIRDAMCVALWARGNHR